MSMISMDLTAAVTAAFGADAMRVHNQLGLELGRDVRADPES
jgi:hypothetical protein